MTHVLVLIVSGNPYPKVKHEIEPFLLLRKMCYDVR